MVRELEKKFSGKHVVFTAQVRFCINNLVFLFILCMPLILSILGVIPYEKLHEILTINFCVVYKLRVRIINIYILTSGHGVELSQR